MRITRLITCLFMLTVAALLGCNGVILNSTYSQLLDQTAALSAETASRADAGQLTPAQMTQSLDGQAQIWAQFRAARDGQTIPATPATPATTTAPASSP